jgi:hypothetical protein
MEPGWFLGSDRNFAAERSAAPAGRAEGSGNLGSDPKNARFRISFLIDPARALPSSGTALSPRRATHFLLRRQEKVSKEKATLVSASPSLRYGATCGARSSRGPARTRLRLRQSRALFRLALRSSAHSQGFCGTGSGRDSVQQSLSNATIFIAACARFTWARGLNHLRTRRTSGFLGSDCNFAAQRSAAPEGRAEAAANLGSDPKNARVRIFLPLPSVCAEERRARRIRASDCLSEASSSSTPAGPSTAGCPQRSGGTQTVGSPFFSLGFFGEAKKCRSPAAATERHRNSSKNLVLESGQGFRHPPQEVKK